MNKRRVAVFCLALIVGLPTARAAEPTVVIVPPQHNLTGDAERVTGEVIEQVSGSLTGQGYVVLPGSAATACEASRGTTDAAALEAVAQRCEVQAAVGLSIDASAMGYNLHFVLVDLEGTIVSDQQSTCDFCTEQEMVAKWGELAAEAGPPSATLVASATAGSEATPEEPVEPLPPLVVEEPESSFGIEDVPWWFWAGAGASLAVSLGVGLPLILIDGEPTCDGPLESCPELYDTDALGYTMLALGIAGLAGVGVGLYLVIAADDDDGEEADSDSTPEAGIALVPGPGGLVLHGFF
ncbi:MAG: hypothetical protein JXB32_01395 [Deltaproteobacteria bacterium]|nr:hypothetical protein [Deltaproteobacteria bacterium]